MNNSNGTAENGIDLEGIAAALTRAAARARSDAERSGTRLVLVRDGKLVRVDPKDASDATPVTDDTVDAASRRANPNPTPKPPQIGLPR
jgi:hypothetical protein